MILQSLVEYYDRLAADPESGIAPIGWSWQKIGWVIDLNADGTLLQLTDWHENREEPGKNGKVIKKTESRSVLVPQAVKRTSGVRANLLWDNSAYVLGSDGSKSKADCFVQTIEALQQPLLSPIITFLRNNPLNQLKEKFPETTKQLLDSNDNISFRLANARSIICDYSEITPAFRAICEKTLTNTSEDETKSLCLVTGTREPLAENEAGPGIKNLPGGNASGCRLVYFQVSSGYDSYGKTKGQTAPISNSASFKYTTALQRLLSSPHNHNRINLAGGNVLLFWASTKDEIGQKVEETTFTLFEPPQDNPDAGVETVKAILHASQQGQLPGLENPDASFCFLGLQGNSGRISIKLWVRQTLKQTVENLVAWFDDLEVYRGAYKNESQPAFSIYRLLLAMSPLDDVKRLPPRLSSDLLVAALQNSRLPDNIALSTLSRLRVGPIRFTHAALLKAWLIRKDYPQPSTERKITPMLDLNNSNVGYCLGRLFAVLEKTQEDALGNINATIKDKYYATASSDPAAVFGTLLRNTVHHLAKLEKGRATYLDKLKQEICGNLSDIPAHLDLADQARFALGYYHQRQSFFTKKEVSENA